jgi:tRNA-uridine 2-sulfurtransferase
MTTRYDGLLMFSGGLDSAIAAHLLKNQGLSLLGIHFVLPFYSGIGREHRQVQSFADALGLPLRIIEEGEEFFTMVRSPKFGFGKSANPCLDCRIHRLEKARKIMEEVGASFIATGEVIGQRPKSQRLECLHLIERRTGLEGRLLRPLCAQHLDPTLPETEGAVKREHLFGWTGRSRHPQLAYAREHGLQHMSPAGGCLLTMVPSGKRYLQLVERYPDFDLTDFKLIAYGRHFLLTDHCRMVIARDDAENEPIEKIVTENDLCFDLADTPGPMGVGRGKFTEEDIATAAAMVARYSRARSEPQVRVKVFRRSGGEQIVTVKPADPAFCEARRV